MSKLSDIFKGFDSSLREGQKRNEDLYKRNVDIVKELYDIKLKDLIINWKDEFVSSKKIRLHNQIRDFFGRDEIHFVAVDGTCKAEETSQFLLFYAGAYGARGSLDIKGQSSSIRYHKWSLEQDVSIVAQVPIPFAELEQVLEEEGKRDPFAVSDFEKVSLAGLHTFLMQLSEIYLAYDTVSSSRMDAPNLILLDQSISSIMASNMVQASAVRMVGCEFGSRELSEADVQIALSHPFNEELEIPTLKKFRQYTGLLRHLERNNGVVNLQDILQSENLNLEQIKDGIHFLQKRKWVSFNSKTNQLAWILDEPINKSWLFSQDVFKSVCQKLFVDKDPQALVYSKADQNTGELRQYWMSPTDIKFLIGVGLRMLIEESWKRNVLLVGIVKDSSSAYFSRNYLGVMKELKVYPELSQVKYPPPSTDRIALELLPLIDENISSPWSTVEFDGVFMTMFMQQEQGGDSHISGVMGGILAPERLTARSLGQFYLNQEKSNPLMGHVIFIERLLYPQWDKGSSLEKPIETKNLGRVNPFFHNDYSQSNIGQKITIYLLNELTRNHFAEVIGYPDPLHKADWGAKTVGRRLSDMLKSVDYMLRANPLSKTFRSIRDSAKR